ncbi:MAG TPA: HIT domain-containing protein [Terriglobales bacterium]|nr:HIT domain-containing protein [Terriglobales bacterium]
MIDRNRREMPVVYCPFCRELQSGTLPDFCDADIESRILHETERFVVIPDISPLVPGHLMIVPRAHILCFGAIEAADWPEFAGIVTATRTILKEYYGSSVILEHGTSSLDPVADHVTHAHLHLVPAAIDIRDALRNFNTTMIASLSDLSGWAARDEEYIFFESCAGERMVADRITGIKRLFFRREIAKQLGIPDPLWDWRRHIMSDNLRSTVETLRRANWKAYAGC